MKAWDFKTNSWIEHQPSFGSKLHGDKEAFFDFNEGRYKKPWSYSKRQRRAFHRCISGLLRAKGRLDRIRFMTLTSSPTIDEKKLNYHFNLLVKQIEYTFGFKMQYWKVETKKKATGFCMFCLGLSMIKCRVRSRRIVLCQGV